MTKPYEKRLSAIQKMLDNSSTEIIEEAYYLLFNLWLENIERNDFNDELKLIAQNHPNLIRGLENHLDESQLEDTEANLFLKKRLEIFTLETSNTSLGTSKNVGETTASPPLNLNTPKYQYSKFEWLQIALVTIVLITILILIISPYIYQKIIVVIAAIIGAINLSYVLPRKYGATSDNLSELKLNFKYPRYVSTYDKNTIDVIIENLMHTEYQGKITLIFDDLDSLVEPASDTKLSATLDIPSLSKESIQFKFILTEKPPQADLIFRFKISRSDQSQYLSNNESLLIAPIPYLRSASTWLFGTLGTLIIALLWDRIKKLLDWE